MNACPECGRRSPGHSLLCPVGIERAKKFQAQLEKERRGHMTQPNTEPGEWDGAILAGQFHFLYESAAPKHGYETRKETRAFYSQSPNGKLMIEVCSKIAALHNADLAALRREIAELREDIGGYEEGRNIAQRRTGDVERQRDSLQRENADLKEARRIANRSADDQMFQKREAEARLVTAEDDSRRLDWLDTHSNGDPWVARQSETGRGYRLHNSNRHEGKPNVREAIDKAAEGEKPAPDCPIPEP